MIHKNKLGSIIRLTGTEFYSLLYLNSRRAFCKIKYMYSVISVIVESLPGNTKNQESTRSWTARVQLVHTWAEGKRRHLSTHTPHNIFQHDFFHMTSVYPHDIFLPTRRTISFNTTSFKRCLSTQRRLSTRTPEG